MCLEVALSGTRDRAGREEQWGDGWGESGVLGRCIPGCSERRLPVSRDAVHESEQRRIVLVGVVHFTILYAGLVSSVCPSAP